MKDNFFVSPSQLEDQHGRSFYLDNAKFFLIFHFGLFIPGVFEKDTNAASTKGVYLHAFVWCSTAYGFCF